MDNHHLLTVAIEAAHCGGEILLAQMKDLPRLTIDTKSEFDFATEVDHESEAAIVSHLQRNFPDHKILAEEGGASGRLESEVEWVIDPLDGTTNYIHGVPNFAVSVAARQQGNVIVGVVFDPIGRDTFTALHNGGAFLNGARIHVSSSSRLHDCLLATGFPFRAKHLTASYLRMFEVFFKNVRDVRRMGTASIDLAYVAAGHFDGFWEYQLKPWDFAAGAILVREAGGGITGFEDSEDFWQTGNILASNGKIHQDMQRIIQSELSGK